MDYKVFIPSAGIGSRLGALSRDVNKAMIKVSGRRIISYIIEKFSADIPFVIALGFQGDDLRKFLLDTYPTRQFDFVVIDRFQGPGSGLGYTMLKCEDNLQCPFIFCANDTIVLEDIMAPSSNWMGYADLDQTEQYRTVEVKDGSVAAIHDKGQSTSGKPYIGLSGIQDHRLFWQLMHDSEAVSMGESYALRGMLEHVDIGAVPFTWYDTGNPVNLQLTRAALAAGNKGKEDAVHGRE